MYEVFPASQDPIEWVLLNNRHMHFVPHSIFPTFSYWDAIFRLIFEVDGGGKQIFPISPQFPPLKNSPSHSKQKTPTSVFSTDPI